MGDPKGEYLFINLGASHVRARLKGFGHGVRKIRSGGRNRAVVIHTATGRHLDELTAIFEDVGCSTTEGSLGEPIESLRNLGPTSAQWLRDAGINSVEQLRRIGPVLSFKIVKQQQPRASFNLLWGLAAGLLDCDWRELTELQKNQLRTEFEELFRR